MWAIFHDLFANIYVQRNDWLFLGYLLEQDARKGPGPTSTPPASLLSLEAFDDVFQAARLNLVLFFHALKFLPEF